jgi:hypothetical protein
VSGVREAVTISAGIDTRIDYHAPRPGRRHSIRDVPQSITVVGRELMTDQLDDEHQR